MGKFTMDALGSESRYQSTKKKDDIAARSEERWSGARGLKRYNNGNRIVKVRPAVRKARAGKYSEKNAIRGKNRNCT